MPQGSLPVGAGIPLVERDHEGPTLVDTVPGDRQVLALQALVGIEQKDHDLGEADRPQGLDAAREGGADDLKVIKGVGPKLEELLHSMGYYHYDQIAAWTEKEVAWVDENLEGFKGRVTRDEWVAQARDLAKG